MGEPHDGLTLVVGAGLSGLVSATMWQEKGEPVLVVEKEAFAGGMARSLHKDGFTFDVGPHFIFQRTSWHDRLFGPEDLVEFSPEIHMVIDGAWIRYPFSLPAVFQVPLAVQMDFVKTRFLGARSSDAPPDSFTGSMSGIYGKGLFEYFFRPYLTRKMGGRDLCDSLHSDWWAATEHDRGVVTRYYGQAEEGRAPAFSRAFRKIASLKQGVAHAFAKQKLLYPKGGFGETGRRLIDGLTERGVEIRLNAPVSRIQRDDRRIISVEVEGESIPVRRVIWTGSPVLLANLLGVEPLKLPTMHVVVFFVTMDRAYPRRGTEVRPLASEAAFYRAYFPERIYPGLTPNGRSALVAEMGTTDLADLECPETRYDAVIDTCVELGLCPRSGVTDVDHVTVPHSHPLFPLDYEEHLRGYYQGLSPLENLILAGRNARFQYFNSHRAMHDGERTAEDVLF